MRVLFPAVAFQVENESALVNEMTHTAGYPKPTKRRAGPPPQPLRGLVAAVSVPRQIRRQSVRFGAVGLRVQSPVFGAAVEISEGGLRLESTTPLVVAGSYLFRLNHGVRFLDLPGRVAWCRPVRLEVSARGRRTVYQAGVELRLAEPDRQWRAALAERAGVAEGV